MSGISGQIAEAEKAVQVMLNWPLEDSVFVLGYSQLEKLFYELQNISKNLTLCMLFSIA